MTAQDSNSNEARLGNTVRIDRAVLVRIIERLDELAGTDNHEENRNLKRFQYRREDIQIHLKQPGSSTTTQFSAYTRDIGASGIAFLHGGYVHTGSSCVVVLEALDGSKLPVCGRVVRCTHARGNVHEVGVNFLEPIDPSLFCAEAARYRVLVVDDDPFMVHLATSHLERLNAHVENAANGEIAVKLALEEPFDLILMDLHMPICDGLNATRQLRDQGYGGTIAAFSSFASSAERLRCLEAGFDIHLEKPFTSDDIAGVLRAVRSDVVRSSFRQDETMTEFINLFVSSLPESVAAMKAATQEEDAESLVALSRGVKERAGSCGFETIAAAAAKVESTVTTVDAADRGLCVVELIRLCRLAQRQDQAQEE